MSPNDWTGHYFVPNGIVTYENCPTCGAPDMRVEHGKSGRGSFQHFEHCTECGDMMVVVCYDCEFCKIEPGGKTERMKSTAEETLRHNRVLLHGDDVDVEGLQGADNECH